MCPAPVGVLCSAAAGLWALALGLLLRSKRSAVASGLGQPGAPVATWALHACLSLASWIAAQTHPSLAPDASVDVPDSLRGQRVELTCDVASDPDVTSLRPTLDVAEFQGRVVAVTAPAAMADAAPTAFQVSMWIPGASRRPQYGERWLVHGRLRKTHRPARWMALRATCPPSWRIVASAPACRRLSQNHGSWWLTRCYEVRREGAALLALGIEDFPETVGLLRALLLGHRSQLQRDIRDAFVMTGTLHIFAISGLHVAIVAYLITAVLQAVRVPRTHWAVLVVPLLIGYTWATGARASAIRACVMGSVYVCAPLLQRKPDVICSLALSALVIVAAAPLQLIDVGFILSFVAVLGIVGLYPVFEQPLRPLWTPDPLRVAPVPRWTAALRAVARYVGSLVSVSCAAWFASTPLTALYFGRFIPVALLGNLLAVPVSFLVTVCGALSFVLGSCVPVLADLFNHANVALVFLMVRPMQVFSAIPGGSIRMDRVPLAAVLLWYAVMIGLSVLVRTKALDRPDATVPS